MSLFKKPTAFEISQSASMSVVDLTSTSFALVPLVEPCQPSVMKRYREFEVWYMDGLTSRHAELIDVQLSEHIREYVGLYCINFGSGAYSRNEFYIWLWSGGKMTELEQRKEGPAGTKRRSIDIERTMRGNR